MAPPTLLVVYFAWVRERIGAGEERIAHPGPRATVADVLDILTKSSPGHAAAFADRARLRAAIDQDYAPLDQAIGDAAELAIFPPVTGGRL